MRPVLFTLIGLLMTDLSWNQTSVLPVGEILEYTAQFNILPAGAATLQNLGREMIDGRETVHVQFYAQTGAFGDRFYKIRDKIDTWLNPRTLTPLKQVKNIREGNFRDVSSFVVDETGREIQTDDGKLTFDTPFRDPYSLLYYLRTIPLKPGDTLVFNTFDNGAFLRFQAKVETPEVVTVPAGTFFCNIVRPFHPEKALFKNQGYMTVWFSRDAKQLPVQIQIKLKFGSMMLRLNEIRTSPPRP